MIQFQFVMDNGLNKDVCRKQNAHQRKHSRHKIIKSALFMVKLSFLFVLCTSALFKLLQPFVSFSLCHKMKLWEMKTNFYVDFGWFITGFGKRQLLSCWCMIGANLVKLSIWILHNWNTGLTAIPKKRTFGSDSWIRDYSFHLRNGWKILDYIFLFNKI